MADRAPWRADRMCAELVAEDPKVRAAALGAALEPGSPLGSCIDALICCCELSANDPQALCLCAVALGAVPREALRPIVLDTLAKMCSSTQAREVRAFAAHALYRHEAMPAAAVPGIVPLLLDPEPGARAAALLALSPFAAAFPQPIVAAIVAANPCMWSNEAMVALVRCAGTDVGARRKVEEFVLRMMRDGDGRQTLIAASVALARVNPEGDALKALVRMAAESDASTAIAAIGAIGDLGEAARPAVPQLVAMLKVAVEAEREEALCRTLVKVRMAAGDAPVARSIERVQLAPDRAAAAHCMLLTLHPRQARGVLGALEQRAEAADEGLLAVIAKTYEIIAGRALVPEAGGV